MSYRSDFALQFVTEKVANDFIASYEKKLAELFEESKKPDSFLNTFSSIECSEDYVKEFSYFNRSQKTIQEKGSVVYYWSGVKFYDYFPEVQAMTDVLETNEYSAIFIRIGEETGDVVEEAYDNGWYDIIDPITYVQSIDIPK